MGVWLRKSSHRIHRFAQMAWLRLFSHGIHRIHRSFVALIRPRNSQNSQKLGCVSPPTDFTDLHRWLGYVCSPTDFTEFTEVRLHKSSHRFHGFAQMAWSRLFSHGIHRSFVASVLPRNSQNSQKFCCVGPPTEFTEFTEVLLRRSSHGIHRIHRSLGVLLAAWVWQDAIPSYICVNPCYLWKPLLCQKVLCIPWVLWEYSLPRISQICTDGLVASVLPRITQICTDGLVASVLPRNSQKFWGAVGSVGTAGCHTLLHLCASVLSVGATSQPEGSVLSVRSVGI